MTVAAASSATANNTRDFLVRKRRICGLDGMARHKATIGVRSPGASVRRVPADGRPSHKSQDTRPRQPGNGKQTPVRCSYFATPTLSSRKSGRLRRPGGTYGEDFPDPLTPRASRARCGRRRTLSRAPIAAASLPRRVAPLKRLEQGREKPGRPHLCLKIRIEAPARRYSSFEAPRDDFLRVLWIPRALCSILT